MRRSPIMYCAMHGHDDVAIQLAAMGASLARVDSTGKNALYFAHTDEIRWKMQAAQVFFIYHDNILLFFSFLYQ